MKRRVDYIILLIAIIGVSLYLWQRNPDRSQYALPQLPAVSVVELDKLEIERAQGNLTITRSGTVWKLQPQQYPADEDLIKKMLDALNSLTLTALVSESESFTRYELDDAHRIRVKAWQGDRLQRDVQLGKAAPSFQHTFVRLGDAPAIYHARDNLRTQFEKDAAALRDKRVLVFDQQQVTEVKMIKGDDIRVFQRKEKVLEPAKEATTSGDTPAAGAPTQTERVWETVDGQPIASDRMNQLLTTLSLLRCASYPEEMTKTQLQDPELTFTIQADQSYELKLFPKTDPAATDTPAVSSFSDYPFLLSKFIAEDLGKAWDELIPGPTSSDAGSSPASSHTPEGK